MLYVVITWPPSPVYDYGPLRIFTESGKNVKSLVFQIELASAQMNLFIFYIVYSTFNSFHVTKLKLLRHKLSNPYNLCLCQFRPFLIKTKTLPTPPIQSHSFYFTL